MGEGGGSVFNTVCHIRVSVWDFAEPIARRGNSKRQCAGNVFPPNFAVKKILDCEDTQGDGLSNHAGDVVASLPGPRGPATLAPIENSGDAGGDHMHGGSSEEIVGFLEDDSRLQWGVSFTGEWPKYDDVDEIEAQFPYDGEFHGSCWNTQALFAAKARKFLKKRSKTLSIVHRSDFTCLQETHATDGRTQAFELPKGYCAVWANGNARQGGVGIVLKRSFLSRFNHIDISRDFEVVVGGESRNFAFERPKRQS